MLVNLLLTVLNLRTPVLETLHAVEIFIFLSILTKPNNLYCFSIHLLSPCQMSHQWALHG